MDDPSRYWLGFEEPFPWPPFAFYAVLFLGSVAGLCWVFSA